MASFRDQYLQSNHSSNSAEENWNEFKNALFKSMDNHIPKKTIKGKVGVPWMTNEVKRLIKKKKRLYNIPDKGQSPYQPMPRIHVILNGVIKCVKRLNPKKASGPDKLPILAL